MSREIADLEGLLARYGADRTRWPAPERLRFAALASESAEARRLVAEAGALDRLLDLAPRGPEETEATRAHAALVERIATAAGREPQPGSSIMTLSQGARAAMRATRPARSRWPAAALLAASLAAGVFIGTSEQVQSELRPLIDAAGWGVPEAADVAGLWDEEAEPPLEEELL